jgi:hypothetical protein
MSDNEQQALPVQPRREPPPTWRGYRLDEVTSSLQKSIRRGLEDDALFWAIELDHSGYGEYCWSRLFVVTSEDVGLADPHMPAVIHALYENWLAIRKRFRGRRPGPATSIGGERLPLAHAVLLLARAPKSRIVDHANAWHTHLAEEGIRAKEIPDVPRQAHAGGQEARPGVRALLRREFAVGGTTTGELSPEPTLPDPYRDKVRAILVEPRGLGSKEKRAASLQDDRPARPTERKLRE